MKQPEEIAGYPAKLCTFIVKTAVSLVTSEMRGSSMEDMQLAIKLIVSMCLNCWDAARGKEEIAERPSEEKMKAVEEILKQITGGEVVHIIDKGNIGPALGKLLGDEEAGNNLADIIKNLVEKKIQKEDMPKWDPHAE